MTLPIDAQYGIIFLSQHPMELQLDEKTLEKAVKCAKNTVQYWFNQWKESKDLSDLKRSGRARATTEKVDQRISKFADSDCIVATNKQ